MSYINTKDVQRSCEMIRDELRCIIKILPSHPDLVNMSKNNIVNVMRNVNKEIINRIAFCYGQIDLLNE